MKRQSIAITTAGLAVTTAVSLIAVPALAAGSGGTHTLHFTSHTIAEHDSNNGGPSVSKDTDHGTFIGYNTSDFTKAGYVDVALTLNDGDLYGQFTVDPKTGAFTGTVTGGSAAYRGDKGTIRGQATSEKNATVTVKYHH